MNKQTRLARQITKAQGELNAALEAGADPTRARDRLAKLTGRNYRATKGTVRA